MDFLFDNPLANLYGPYFLILYGLIIFWTIIGYRLIRKSLDRSERFGIPPIPHNPDAFEIAYLRGGANELARAVVFALAQKNLLRFENEEKISRICPTDINFERRSLQPIELAALEWFNANRQPNELFQKDGLTDALRPFGETYRARLEMQHLIADAEMNRRNNFLVLKSFAVFAAIGAYKFVAAIYNGSWNVFGIVVMGIVGTVILLIAGHLPRLTKLGANYLERLQLAFERVKPSNHFPAEANYAPSATFAAVDPFLLSVGVFGGAALAGTVYSDYNRTFEKAQNNSAGGSSCGSGCGSSSSCSSSGCGSGCGGGCGGGCG